MLSRVVAAWWVMGVLMVSQIHGWDGDVALSPFTEMWAAMN